MKIWLDDKQPPPSPGWQVCRSVTVAKDLVRQDGWPDFVSFDHDLGVDEPTGLDFAKWLIERDLEYGDMPKNFGFAVHSMNPVGAENIGRLMTNQLKHL